MARPTVRPSAAKDPTDADLAADVTRHLRKVVYLDPTPDAGQSLSADALTGTRRGGPQFDDLVTYARAHLRGLLGSDGFLRATSIMELHRPEAGPTQPVHLFGSPVGYAAGWIIYAMPGSGHRVSWHNGSAGRFFGWITILPDDGLTIAVVTNVGGRERGERGCRELTALALDRLGALKAPPRGAESR